MVGGGLMEQDQRKDLFAPRDFIPTSVIWGFWVAAVMAGVNFVRLGQRTRGKRLMLSGILAQLFVCAGVVALRLLTGAGGETGAQDSTWPDLQFRLPWGWPELILLLINVAVGCWLYQAQKEMYKQWAAQHPPSMRKSPYLAWWVSLLAIAGMLLILLLIFYRYVMA
jgi:hypothetical protein